jgi:hypothetical protein
MSANLVSPKGYEGSFEEPPGAVTFVPNVQIPGTNPPVNYPGLVDLAPNNVVAGWRVLDTAHVAWLGPDNPQGPSASDGKLFVDLSGGGRGFGVIQTLEPLATKARRRYRVSLAIGTYERKQGMGGPVAVLVEANGTRALLRHDHESGPDALQWRRDGFEFVATATRTPLTLAAYDQGTGTPGYVGVDDVVVEEIRPTIWQILEIIAQTWRDWLRAIGRWFGR